MNANVREWLINQAAAAMWNTIRTAGTTAWLRNKLGPDRRRKPFLRRRGFFVVKAMTNAVSRIEDHFRMAAECSGASTIRLYSLARKSFSGPISRTSGRYAGFVAHRNEEKLNDGGKSCGHRLWPRGLDNHHGPRLSQVAVLGFSNNHEASIHMRGEAAAAAGVADRDNFEMADARPSPAENYVGLLL